MAPMACLRRRAQGVQLRACQCVRSLGMEPQVVVVTSELCFRAGGSGVLGGFFPVKGSLGGVLTGLTRRCRQFCVTPVFLSVTV
jgi:hypothetical protein